MSKKYIISAVIAIALMSALILGISRENGGAQSVQKDKKEPFCMLVLGKDRASGLSDVIMLVSVDTDAKRAVVMQIPRDTYAYYGEDSHRKLNSAAAYLGEDKMCSFLANALGVKIDGYVSLGLDAFRSVVDRIGGVEMELDAPLNYEDPEQGLYIHLPKGKQTLDGEAAEKLVRYRSGYAQGDLGRLDVQKRFLAAFFSELKDSINLTNIYGLASDLLPQLKTNISSAKLVSLAVEMLGIKLNDVELFTLPGQAVVSDTSGASFYVMSATSADEAMCTYFGKTTEGIDKNRAFLHSDNENFKNAYNKKAEFSVYRAEDLN